MSDHDIQPMSDPNQPGVNPASSGKDVLGMIAEVESQLESLKRAHEQRRKELEEIKAQREELLRESERISAQAAEAENLRDQSAREFEQAQSRVRELDEREGEVNRRASELEQRSARLESREREVEQEAESERQRLASAHDQLNERASELEKLQGELDSHRAQFEQDLGTAQDLTNKISQLEEELTSSEAGARALDTKLSEVASDRDAARQELDATQQQHQQSVDALQQQLSESSCQINELKGRLDEAEASRQQWSEKAEYAELERDEAREQAENQTQQLQGVQEELAAVRSSTEAESADLREQLSQARQHAEALQERLASSLAELSEFTRTATLHDEEVATLNHTLLEAQDRARQAEQSRDRAESALEQHRERVAQLELELSRTADSLKAASDGQGEVAELISEIDRLTGELTSREKDIDRLATELEQSKTQHATALEQGRDSDDRLGLTESQLDEAHQRIEDLERAIERHQSVGADPAVHEWNTSRRSRLRRAKDLFKAQSTKIRKANELLAQRFEQCESLLKQRKEVLDASREIKRAEEKSASKRGGVAAVWIVAGVLFASLSLGAMSWFLAERFAPAQYAARATIVVQSDREPTPAQLAEWQKYHEELVREPRLIERTADRMKRRGIEDLSDTGTLRARLDQDLASHSSSAGRLELELRGFGKARTRRELETYARAFVSESNAVRERRAVGDGAMMDGDVIVEGPIDQTQPVYAAAGFGGGAVIGGITMLLLWRRLSKSKSDFELSGKLETLADDSRWTTPGNS